MNVLNKIAELTRKEFEKELLYSPDGEYSDADTLSAKWSFRGEMAFYSKKEAVEVWREQRNDARRAMRGKNEQN